jgi:hypothetical protein
MDWGRFVLVGWWVGTDEDIVISAVLLILLIHGHRTLKVPHPVRSAKSSRVPPS